MEGVSEKMAKVRHILDLSSEERKQFANSFDVFMTDCDGVLWNVLSPIPGTGDALNDLEANGKKVILVSNNSMRPDSNYEERVTKIGATFRRENLVHPIHSIIRYLKKTKFTGLIYMIGMSLTKNLVREAGYEVIDGPLGLVDESFLNLAQSVNDKLPVKCVIYEADMNFSFAQFMRSELYLRQPDCQLIVGATDRILGITGEFSIPGPGPFVQAIIDSLPVGKKPIVLGKPGFELTELLKEQFEIKNPKRVLFVGDMFGTDIKIGGVGGYQSLLVLSGGTTREKMLANKDPEAIPDYYADSVADLSTLLRSLQPQSVL
ncbi:4-nitrophenylphosphatase [Sergentomyia squamirostris]